MQKLSEELYGKEADYVDWKHFLVCVAKPWPEPSPQQLVQAVERFWSEAGRGKLAMRAHYEAVETWLMRKARQDKERGEGRVFNRVEGLIEFLFDLFTNKNQMLDYTEMVREGSGYQILTNSLQ